MAEYFKEITPLTQFDCFTLFARQKSCFDFPIHTHHEFELNLILHGQGVKRIVGEHIGVISDMELVLVGSNLPHGWLTNHYEEREGVNNIFEITIQFHPDLMDDKFLDRNQMFFLKSMFEKAANGILFSQATIASIKERIISLTKMSGFGSVLELFSILHDLSMSSDMLVLGNETYKTSLPNLKGEKIEKILKYINDNYEKDITLKNIAEHALMTEVSFSRYIKRTTGKTFIEALNGIRLVFASRMLIDSDATVSEIAFKSGFRNLSYFNRLFKQKKGKTPVEYRQEFHSFGIRTFV